MIPVIAYADDATSRRIVESNKEIIDQPYVILSEEYHGSHLKIYTEKLMVNAAINADLTVYAKDVYIDATVNGTVTIFALNTIVDTAIQKDLQLYFGTGVLTQQSLCMGNVVSIMSSLDLYGYIRGNVMFTGLYLDHKGQIDGDLLFFGGLLSLDSPEIRGELLYASPFPFHPPNKQAYEGKLRVIPFFQQTITMLKPLENAIKFFFAFLHFGNVVLAMVLLRFKNDFFLNLCYNSVSTATLVLVSSLVINFLVIGLGIVLLGSILLLSVGGILLLISFLSVTSGITFFLIFLSNQIHYKLTLIPRLWLAIIIGSLFIIASFHYIGIGISMVCGVFGFYTFLFKLSTLIFRKMKTQSFLQSFIHKGEEA